MTTATFLRTQELLRDLHERQTRASILFPLAIFVGVAFSAYLVTKSAKARRQSTPFRLFGQERDAGMVLWRAVVLLVLFLAGGVWGLSQMI